MAREGAQNKIVVLELEMETASRDLKLEKQGLQGAQELIVLRYVPIAISSWGLLSVFMIILLSIFLRFSTMN